MGGKTGDKSLYDFFGRTLAPHFSSLFQICIELCFMSLCLRNMFSVLRGREFANVSIE